MNNLLNLINILSKSSTDNNEHKQDIPQEILSQYPYGDFPIRYTKSGQESLRRESEKRYAYEKKEDEQSSHTNNISIAELIPFLQLLGNKKEPTETFQLLTKLLFKDNKEIESLFKLIPKSKPQEIDHENEFPNTNKVKINSLQRIN